MKTTNKILFLVALLGLLSSCTQRRYSQLTGFQFNKKQKTEKTRLVHSGHFVEKTKADVIEDNVELVACENNTKEVEEQNTSESVNDSKANIFQRGFKSKKKVAKLLVSDNKTIKTFQNGLNPVKRHKKVKSVAKSKSKDSGLLNIILIVVLALLIIALLERIIGPWLSGILVLVVLIILVLYLLGSL